MKFHKKEEFLDTHCMNTGERVRRMYYEGESLPTPVNLHNSYGRDCDITEISLWK